jgi:hypothetical protein
MSDAHTERESVSITLLLPSHLVACVDELAKRELLSRSSFVRRELLLAVRQAGLAEQSQRVSA